MRHTADIKTNNLFNGMLKQRAPPYSILVYSIPDIALAKLFYVLNLCSNHFRLLNAGMEEQKVYTIKLYVGIDETFKNF